MAARRRELIAQLACEPAQRPTSFSATEFRSNLGKYLELFQTEDVYITRNGKVVAKLTNPRAEKLEIAKSLFGIIPGTVTLEESQAERLGTI